MEAEARMMKTMTMMVSSTSARKEVMAERAEKFQGRDRDPTQGTAGRVLLVRTTLALALSARQGQEAKETTSRWCGRASCGRPIDMERGGSGAGHAYVPRNCTTSPVIARPMKQKVKATWSSTNLALICTCAPS